MKAGSRIAVGAVGAVAIMVTAAGVVSQQTKFEYTVQIVEAIDGDTFRAINPAWPEPLREITIRVNGVDTPEKGGRAKCAKEAKLGELATIYAKEFAKRTPIAVITYDTKEKDKFGRVLSDVIAPDGRAYSQQIIAAGFAREYHGEHKSDWCR